MLDIINGWIYRLIERLWALPDDLFELEDDENAIIEEQAGLLDPPKLNLQEKTNGNNESIIDQQSPSTKDAGWTWLIRCNNTEDKNPEQDRTS